MPNLDEFVSDYMDMCDGQPTNREIAEAWVETYGADAWSEADNVSEVARVLQSLPYYTGQPS